MFPEDGTAVEKTVRCELKPHTTAQLHWVASSTV